MEKRKGSSIVMIVLGAIILILIVLLVLTTVMKKEQGLSISSLHEEIQKYREELKSATASISDLSNFDYTGTDILDYIPSMKDKKIEGVEEIYLFSIENGLLKMNNTSKLLEMVEINVLKASEPELYTTAGFYDLDGNLVYSWNEL